MINKALKAVMCFLTAFASCMLPFHQCMQIQAFDDTTEEFLFNGNIYYQVNEYG